MKKFWIILIALGLVAGFAVSASAVDVKFSGQYYVQGSYVDNPSYREKNVATPGYQSIGSQAFFNTRTRLNVTFQVAEGLALKFERIDMLEKKWGDLSWSATNETLNRREGSFTSATAPRTQENIEIERAYLDFTTKIGRFLVGYQNTDQFGTDAFDSYDTRGMIKYMLPIGPLTLIADAEKKQDKNSGSTPLGGGITSDTSTTDADWNLYSLRAIYKFGPGEAGLLYQYLMNNNARPTLEYSTKINIINPYAKVKFGPVFVEAEGIWATGDLRKYEGSMATTPTVTVDAFGFFVHGRADFGPAYAGLQFAWVRGDDPDTTDKVEGNMMGTLGYGSSYDPGLILFNDDMNTWIGNRQGYATVATSTFVDNAWIYKAYAGFKPTAKSNITMSVIYAYADKKPKAPFTPAGVAYAGDVYGTEVDLVATYKIFDNLEYKIGAGYLFVGDYYKGITTNKIDNEFLLLHKLTLNF